MRGAALATVMAQAATAAWVLLYFLGGTSVLRFRARNLRLDRAICRSIFAIGSPACRDAACRQPAVERPEQPASDPGRQAHAHGGDLAVAAMGVIYIVMMTVFMPIFGLNQGVQPIIGYNYGARRFDRVKKTLETAILLATAWTVCGFLLTWLFPAPDRPALLPREEDVGGPGGVGEPRHADLHADDADRRFPDRQRELLSGGGQAEGGDAVDALAAVADPGPGRVGLAPFFRSGRRLGGPADGRPRAPRC